MVTGCERMDRFPGENSTHPLCHSLGMHYIMVALEDFPHQHMAVVLHMWTS